MGVHLTLAREWDSYRWKPLTTNDPASGLLDAEGYCHRGPGGVWPVTVESAVEAEIAAQLNRALAAGIDVTHLDSHMDTLVHPSMIPAYVGLARHQRLPPLIVGLNAERFLARGFDAATAAAAEQQGQELAAAGMLVVDDLQMPSLDDPTDRVEVCKRIIAGLAPGLTLLRIHPALDTPELRAMAPDWRCRVADYAAFTSPILRDYIHDAGVRVSVKVLQRRAMRGNVVGATQRGRPHRPHRATMGRPHRAAPTPSLFVERRCKTMTLTHVGSRDTRRRISTGGFSA